MTTKLEQAARQALEALEVSTDWDVGARGKQLQSMKAITALREALAEPELNLNCKSVQKRLATSWGYVKAEQEDEIDWIETNKALAKEIIELKKQAEQEPVAWVAEDVCDGQFINGRKRRIWWECIEGAGTPLYAAPVHTKDLTDTEIHGIKGYNETREMYDFAHAVISAYKEKQK